MAIDEALAPLLREILQGKTGHAVMRVSSDSMRPRLLEGDRIEVRGASPRSLRPGDVVVFESEGAGIVVHRLIWREPPLGQPTRIYTRGDALERLDHAVQASRVLGRVEWVIRGESRFSATRPADRLRCWAQAAGLGIRRWGRRLTKLRRTGTRETG